MKSDLRPFKLGEIADVLTGFAFKSAEYGTDSGAARVVRGDNVTEHSLRWGDKTRYWEEITPDLERYLLESGDIVIGMDGSKVGQNFAVVADSDLPLILAQRVARLRAKAFVSQDYLQYLICNEAFAQYVNSIKTGTSIPHISKTQIENFPVLIPSEEVQASVVEFLSALDGKIESCRRINDILDRMWRLMFESWFVRFIPHPVSDTALPTLETEDGRLPAGWRYEPVSNLADLNKSVWSVKTAPSEIQYLDLTSVKWGIAESPVKLAFADAPSRARRRVVDGDTIIGLVRPGNGAYCFIQNPPETLTVSTGFAVITPKKQHHMFLLYLALTQESYVRYLAQVADGAAYPAIRPDIIADTKILVPPDDALKTLHEILSPLFRRWDFNSKHMQTLSDIRFALMPKLLQGQISLLNQDAQYEPVAV